MNREDRRREAHHLARQASKGPDRTNVALIDASGKRVAAIPQEDAHARVWGVDWQRYEAVFGVPQAPWVRLLVAHEDNRPAYQLERRFIAVAALDPDPDAPVLVAEPPLVLTVTFSVGAEPPNALQVEVVRHGLMADLVEDRHLLTATTDGKAWVVLKKLLPGTWRRLSDDVPLAPAAP